MRTGLHLMPPGRPAPVSILLVVAAVLAVLVAWGLPVPAAGADGHDGDEGRLVLPLPAAWGSDGFGQLGYGRVRFNALKADAPGPKTGQGHVKAGQGGSKGAYAQVGHHGPHGRPPVLVPPYSTVPGTMAALADKNVAAMIGGGFHGLALMKDGTVRAWGRNTFGQLGNGTTTDSRTAVPVPGLTGVVALAAGTYHSLALMKNGTVRAWGLNIAGQLGNGTVVNSSTPILVPGLTGVRAIAAGDAHSLVLMSDGTIRAWGLNSVGQLGDDSTAPHLTPVPVVSQQVVRTGPGDPPLSSPPLRGVRAIAAGTVHSLALMNDGTVKAWGNNQHGQLGDRTNATRTFPVAVARLRNVRAIAAGGDHNLALLPDGSVAAWGENFSGQIGNGTSGNTFDFPVSVSWLKRVRAIDAGTYHSLALLEDGTMRAWGSNSHGQLGDGTILDRRVPTPVVGLRGARTIAAGEVFSLAA